MVRTHSDMEPAIADTLQSQSKGARVSSKSPHATNISTVTRGCRISVLFVVIAALFVVPPIVRATATIKSSSPIRLNRGFETPPSKGDVMMSPERHRPRGDARAGTAARRAALVAATTSAPSRAIRSLSRSAARSTRPHSSLTVRVAAVAVTHCPTYASRRERPRGRAAVLAWGPMKKRAILIVDEAPSVFALKAFLETGGEFCVDVASTGYDALRHLGASVPHALLSRRHCRTCRSANCVARSARGSERRSCRSSCWVSAQRSRGHRRT